MEKIKKVFEQNKVYILAGLVGVSALGAFLYLKPKTPIANGQKQVSTKEPSISSSTNQVQEGVVPEQSEEKTLVRVINRLKKLLTGDAIDYQAVKAIYKAQFQLSRQEFKTAILANRRQRRNFLANIAEYQKVFTKYETEVQNIHNKHLNAVLAHFRIDKGGWMELTEGASLQHSEEWSELLIDCEQEELESIRETDKPRLKLSTLIEIEKYRLKLLKQKINQFKQTFASLDKSDLYNLVQKWGFDSIFAKYHVQEQDMIFSRQQLSAEEKQKLQQYEQDIQNIMEELICDDDGHSQSAQNQNARPEDQ